MMRNTLLLYVLIAMITACSQVEYTASKSHYQILPTTTMPATINVGSPAFEKKDNAMGSNVALPVIPKITPTVIVTKKDPKSLGNVYLPNSFSANREDVVFEIRKESGGYKALTPFLFNSPGFSSNLSLSLSLNARTALTAGLEVKIPFDTSGMK